MTSATVAALPAHTALLLRARRQTPHQCRGVDTSMPEGLRRTMVDVPYSIVTGPLRDLTVVYIAKVAQLARNRDHQCVAALTTMATWLGLTNRTAVDPRTGKTVTKAPSSLFAAQKEAIEAGLVAVRRRTHRGGRGTSAVRTLTPSAAGDFKVPVPVALLGAVSARHVRTYMLMTYAHLRRIPFSEADLASAIRIQSGPRAGEPISAYAASRLIDDLESWGWFEVLRRAGHRGRHIVIPRRSLLDAVVGPADTDPTPARGSSKVEASADLGSEASADLPRVEEDHSPDVQESMGLQLTAPSPEGEVGGAAPVEDPQEQRAGHLVLRTDRASKSIQRPKYTGPTLTVDGVIVYVLEPVRALLDQGRVNVYVQRRVARAIYAQLALAIAPERIRQRLQQRYLGADFDVRQPNGWLLKAVERWGCEKAECEEGVIWDTGERCERCHFRREESRRAGLTAWRAAHPAEAEAGDLRWEEKRAQITREKAARQRSNDTVVKRLAIREAVPGDGECIGDGGICGRPVSHVGATLCPACAGHKRCPVIGCWTWHRTDVCPDPNALTSEHLTVRRQNSTFEGFANSVPFVTNLATDSELLIGRL